MPCFQWLNMILGLLLFSLQINWSHLPIIFLLRLEISDHCFIIHVIQEHDLTLGLLM